MSESIRKKSDSGIAAIVVPCSARKQKLPSRSLRVQHSVRRASQVQAEEAWKTRLQEVSECELVAARDLYAGQGFDRARRSAEDANCALFIVSAGLGLVRGDTKVPAYDLTISPSAVDGLQSRLIETLNHEAWWAALQRMRFASPLADLGEGKGRIVMALSQPYAKLIGDALMGLPPATRSRLRLLGAGLGAHLPSTLQNQIIHYDARLDVVFPGTKLDFASRALAHFAQAFADRPMASVVDDQRRVRRSFVRIKAPAVVVRPRVDDAILTKHIKSLVRRGFSATSGLRHLRSEMCIACEERRFRTLFEDMIDEAG